MKKDIFPQLIIELGSFRKDYDLKNYKKCEIHLGRAHLLSQKSFFYHLSVHWIMIMYAFGRRNYNELRGQAIRLLLVIPGHLTGKIPKGNTGWTSVGLTTPMPIPKDLKHLFE